MYSCRRWLLYTKKTAAAWPDHKLVCHNASGSNEFLELSLEHKTHLSDQEVPACGNHDAALVTPKPSNGHPSHDGQHAGMHPNGPQPACQALEGVQARALPEHLIPFLHKNPAQILDICIWQDLGAALVVDALRCLSKTPSVWQSFSSGHCLLVM